MPLVSVIIPTYNRGLYLPDAVDSVLRQTFQDFEVIVVDDGSTDDTAGVMQRYAGDPRVRYFRKENGGCASARNYGLRLARGEFVEHLDSDDVLVETDIALKVDVLQSLPDDVGGVFSDCYRCVRSDSPEDKTYFQNIDFIDSIQSLVESYTPEKKMYLLSRSFYERHLTECLITPNILLRKSVYDNAGLYDESYVSGQDWAWFTAMTRHYRVACINQPLMYWRFWIKGNASDRVRVTTSTLKMLNYFLKVEKKDVTLQYKLKEAIGQAHFERAYAYYKDLKKRLALQDAIAAIRRGVHPGQSIGLVLLCLLPDGMAGLLKRVNPYRGRPIE